MPAITVASCPGRTCRCTCAQRAVSVRRGSITTILAPRSTARGEPLRRVLGEELLRDHRVRSREEERIAVVERNPSAEPQAVHGVTDTRARLVDRRGREHHLATEGHHQGRRHRAHGGIRGARRADVDRDRVGTVTVDDVAQPIGDLHDRVVARDLLVGSVGPTAQAAQQPLRVGVDLGEGAPLRAGVALVQRRLAIAVHLDGPPVLDGHENRAQRGAQPAGARLDGGRGVRGGHDDLAVTRSPKRRQRGVWPSSRSTRGGQILHVRQALKARDLLRRAERRARGGGLNPSSSRRRSSRGGCRRGLRAERSRR